MTESVFDLRHSLAESTTKGGEGSTTRRRYSLAGSVVSKKPKYTKIHSSSPYVGITVADNMDGVTERETDTETGH